MFIGSVVEHTHRVYTVGLFLVEVGGGLSRIWRDCTEGECEQGKTGDRKAVRAVALGKR